MSNITTIEELKKRKYITVNLPGWGIDDVFTCKLQSVGMMDLASKGKIPNPLIPVVVDLFKGTYKLEEAASNIDGLKKMNDLMDFFAEVTMVEPTFQEVQQAIGLTDEQKMIIYLFVVKGAKQLEPFFEKQRSNEHDRNGEDLQQATKSTT